MKWSCITCLLACAWAAHAAPSFDLIFVDARTSVIPEDPVLGINITGGTIYQDGFGGAGATDEPNQAFIAPVPSLQYDSYVTIDRGPIEAAPGYDGTDVPPASSLAGEGGWTTTTFRNAWTVFDSGGVTAFPKVKEPAPGTSHELFLGRITHTGTLTGRLGADIFEEFAPPVARTIVGDIVSEADLASGAGWILEDVSGTPLIAALAFNAGYAFVKTWQGYTVTDIYLQSLTMVPSPGAPGLALIAGACAVRRRR